MVNMEWRGYMARVCTESLKRENKHFPNRYTCAKVVANVFKPIGFSDFAYDVNKSIYNSNSKKFDEYEWGFIFFRRLYKYVKNKGVNFIWAIQKRCLCA